MTKHAIIFLILDEHDMISLLSPDIQFRRRKMPVLSKSESHLVFESWALASNEKEKHGGAFMVK